jgi:hypothetical protein
MKDFFQKTLTKINSSLFSKTNTIVSSVAVFSLIWIFAYKLFFTKQISIFNGATEVGEIFFNLLSSVVASCIFYFFVVYLEQRRIAREVYPALRGRLNTFKINIFNIMLGMHNRKGMTPALDLPSRERLLELCEGITLSSRPPQIFGNPPIDTNNWFEYFDYMFHSDNYISNLLYAQVSFLPSKIISKLDEIQYSPFQRALTHYRETKYSDSLSNLINPFLHYLKCLDDLAKMAESNLK